MLDSCHTRINKSSLHAFNFYVISAGHDMTGLPRAGENSKPFHYKQKIQKNEGPGEKGFHGKNRLKISDRKYASSRTKQLRETHGQHMQLLKMDFVTWKK